MGGIPGYLHPPEIITLPVPAEPMTNWQYFIVLRGVPYHARFGESQEIADVSRQVFRDTREGFSQKWIRGQGFGVYYGDNGMPQPNVFKPGK